MEPRQPGLPSPEEMDDGLYHFIRENNDQGVALRQEGELDEAIANYDRVLSIKGDVAVVYNNRGEAQYQVQKFDHAIADYSHALKINPEFAIACLNRGLAWCTLNRSDRAAGDFSRVVELNPELLKAHRRVSESLKNHSIDRVCKEFE